MKKISAAERAWLAYSEGMSGVMPVMRDAMKDVFMSGYRASQDKIRVTPRPIHEREMSQ